MKHISFEEFINDLKKSKAGREYIKLVSNPKNNLSPDEPGEDHHIHMRSLGGETGPQVRLSYLNHCKAHALLAKASLEINAPWQFEALNTINIMSGKRFDNLSDVEQITLEDIYTWGELRMIGNEKKSYIQKEIWENKSEEEKEEFRNICKERWENTTKEKMEEFGDIQSKVQKERWDNISGEERELFRNTQKEAHNKQEVKDKQSKSGKEAWFNKTYEERELFRNTQKEAQNRPDVKEKMRKSCKEAQNRPDVKENRCKIMKGKNKGKIKIVNNNEPKFKKIFPVDLPYWESLGWYRAKKVA